MSLSRWSVLASVIGVFALAVSPAFAAARPKASTPHIKPSTQRSHAAKPARTATTKPAPVTRGSAAKPTKAAKPAKPVKTVSTPTTQTTVRANGKGNGKKPETLAAGRATTDAGTRTATGVGATTTTWTPTNAVAEKLSGKPNLLAKARAVLPPGTDLNLATSNFKNFGQFNAAVNAARNHGISFVELRSLMTGTTLAGIPTGQPILSLGQALQRLKPGIDATAAAQTATAQSNAEIASGPTTTSRSTIGTSNSRKLHTSNVGARSSSR